MNKQEQQIFNDISSLADDKFEVGNYGDGCPPDEGKNFCLRMARINYEDKISDVMADYGNEITFLFAEFILSRIFSSKYEEKYDKCDKFILRYSEILIKCYQPIIDKIYNDQMRHRLAEANIMQEDKLDYLQRGD